MNSNNYVSYEEYFSTPDTLKLNNSQFAFAIGPTTEVLDLSVTKGKSIAEVLTEYKSKFGLPSRINTTDLVVIDVDTNAQTDLYSSPQPGVTYTFIYHHDAKG